MANDFVMAGAGDPKIGIVILNWNGGQLLERCVESVMASRGIQPVVLVLDNGSSDGSIAPISKRWHMIRTIKRDTNEGVAKGFNTGITWARDAGLRYVFLLNCDALVNADCLSRLLRTLTKAKESAIVTPRILDEAGRIWFDGGKFNACGYPAHRRMGWRARRAAPPFPEMFATGCAMLLDVSVVERSGNFAEEYFAYAEDVDFSLRVRRSGALILHDASAIVTHFPSSAVKSTKGAWFRDYYVTRNNLLLFERRGRPKRWRFLSYFLLWRVSIPAVYYLFTGARERTVALFHGVRDFKARNFGGRYV